MGRPYALAVAGALVLAGCGPVAGNFDTPAGVVEHYFHFLDRQASIEFADTPFTECVNFMQTKHKLGSIIVSQGGLDAAVTVKCKDEPLWSIYDRICAAAKMEWTITPAAFGGCIEIGTPEDIRLAKAEHPKWSRACARFRRRRPDPTAHRAHKDSPEAMVRCFFRQLGPHTTLEFVDTPTSEVLHFLQILSKVNWVGAPGDGEDKSITLKMRDVPRWQVLDAVCTEANSAWTIAPFEGVACIQIDTPEKIRDVERNNPEWARAFAKLKKACELEFRKRKQEQSEPTGVRRSSRLALWELEVGRTRVDMEEFIDNVRATIRRGDKAKAAGDNDAAAGQYERVIAVLPWLPESETTLTLKRDVEAKLRALPESTQ